MTDETTVDNTDDTIDLLQPEIAANPYPLYQHLRDHRPVCPLKHGGLLAISRYHDVVDALSNPGLFSSTGVADAFAPEWLEESLPSSDFKIALEDEPYHSRHKSLISKAFVHNAIEMLKPAIRAAAVRIINGIIADQPVELINDIAYPYSESNIYHLIGIDSNEQNASIREWSQRLDKPPREPDLNYLQLVKHYNQDISQYCLALVRSRHQTRTDDFISTFLDNDTDNILSLEDKAGVLELLLRASAFPIALLLSHAILQLSRNPTLLEQLKAAPQTKIMRAFIDELLRHDSPGHITARRTTDDVNVAGVPIAKDTRVYLLLAAANRDPNHFTNPGAFDITRPNNNTHVSLGYGSHRCLGERLIRAQISVFIEVLLQRFSTIICPAPEQLDWYYSLVARSFNQLPARFR